MPVEHAAAEGVEDFWGIRQTRLNCAVPAAAHQALHRRPLRTASIGWLPNRAPSRLRVVEPPWSGESSFLRSVPDVADEVRLAPTRLTW